MFSKLTWTLGWHGLQLLFKQYYIEKQVLSVDMDFTYINITYDITNKIQLTLGWHVIVGNLLELFWQTVCFMTWCPAILVVICSHCPAKISLPKSLIDTLISGRYFSHFFFSFINFFCYLCHTPFSEKDCSNQNFSLQKLIAAPIFL